MEFDIRAGKPFSSLVLLMEWMQLQEQGPYFLPLLSP